jgi:hypothetical protein
MREQPADSSIDQIFGVVVGLLEVMGRKKHSLIPYDPAITTHKIPAKPSGNLLDAIEADSNDRVFHNDSIIAEAN